MLGNAEPMDMGPVDLWAMTQKVEMPLYQMASFGGKNTIMVDNARENTSGKHLYLKNFLYQWVFKMLLMQQDKQEG